MASLPKFTSQAASYYPLLRTLNVEKNFDHVSGVGWYQQYWSSGFIFCSMYLIFIYAGQRWMRHRERFQLRLPLALWSLFLAVFSWICALRFWSEFHYIVHTYGWHSTVCDPIWLTSVSGCWAWLFACSKLIELGDTVFIVLRKQKLIFLHWYHHVSVLLYTWYSYGHGIAAGRYFVLVNASVHAIMYSYYAIKASKLLTIPSFINIFITGFQIVQMVVGMLVNFYAFHALNEGKQCENNYGNIQASFLMYLSYFLLFVHFFYNAYLGKKSKAQQHVAKSSTDNNENITANHANGTTKKEL